MYLVDTNVFLELILEQAKVNEVDRFFSDISSDSIYLTDFSFYSVGIILLARKKPEAFKKFVSKVIQDVQKDLLRLEAQQMDDLLLVSQRFSLDFDDAYQYTIAEKYDLTIVSFDKDFDRTERGRKTPAQILKS